MHVTTVASRFLAASPTESETVTAPHLPDGLGVPAAPVRVVPLTVDLGAVSGQKVVLLSLEVWPQWVDLRFARIDVGADRPLPRRVPPVDAWRVTSDGEPLEVLDAVGRGDRHFSNGEVRLAPVPAEGASLDVSVTVVPGTPPLTATITA
ncbi:MAG TPA: hypothetical protein VK906_05805 [Egicoccus sp.]|nr:hypothetical protein [Egicoccus sp.]HSK22666.1 hypothetical protein [Egicoccus sp.]